MARISEDDIARVREATDVVALISERVVLKRKGRLYWACCPFHQEKTPSFKVDPASGLWHCFGCGAGGDAFGFLMKSDNLNFTEAVTTLADRAHIEIEAFDEGGANKGIRERTYAVCKETAAFYHAVLTRSPTKEVTNGRDYLAQRGYGSEVASEWLLGYAPGRGMLVAHLRERGHSDEDMIQANVALKNDAGVLRDRFYERVMFPIRDLQGRVCAFGGRILGEGHPKYLNTNDTPIFHKSNTLYGLDVAKNNIVKTKIALVVEGYTDVIALHKAGHTNAVATLGTALTGGHVKLLSRFAQQVIYVFDGDAAGLRAADRAVEFIDETITPEATKNPVMLDVMVLPTNSDPADMMETDEGRERFDELLNQTTPLITFSLQRRLSDYDLSRPEQQVRALEDAVSILAPIKTSSIAASYARDLADMFATAGSSIDSTQVMNALSRARVIPRRGDYEISAEEKNHQHAVEPEVSYDPREIETLGLMIANPKIRRDLAETMSPEVFTAELLQDVFLMISQCDPKTDSSVLLSELIGIDSRIAPLFSSYDFEAGALAKEGIGDEFARSLAQNLYERQLRSMKAQMRAESDKKAKQFLVEQIVDLQNKIIENK